jgi:DNA-binding HxlR family transcriptional regulator
VRLGDVPHDGQAEARARQASCGVGAVEAVEDTWGVGRHAHRVCDLSRKLAGISPKMLTQTRRTLERDGILTRTVTPSVPLRVDYELTDLDASLALLLTTVKTWAETHIEQVHEARERYDTENQGGANV